MAIWNGVRTTPTMIAKATFAAVTIPSQTVWMTFQAVWKAPVMASQAVARGWTTQVLKVSLTVLQVLVHQSPTAWSMPLQTVATQFMKDWKASVMEAQIWRPVSVWVKK